MKQKLLLCLLMILCVCFGFSRETGKFGFLFKAGSSSSVGLTFNVSDRVTLRPSLGFYTAKTECEDNTPEKDTGYSVGLGLFYHFLKKNSFTAYSGLEMGYSHQTGEFTVCADGICWTQEETINGYTGDLIFGFQYNFNKHVAVFGEIGFGFWKRKLNYQTLLDMTGTSKRTSWSLNRSGFGIILYL